MSAVGHWREHLPSGWTVMPLKAVADYMVSNVDKHSFEDEIPVRLCNYTDVYKNEFIHPGMDLMQATATEAEIEKFQLRVADVVITKDSERWDDIAIPALVTETAEDLVCGYHLAMIRASDDRINGAFLFRLLQSRDIRLPLELASTGVTRFGLGKEEIGKLEIPVPPIQVQKRIVDHLNSETSTIDALMQEGQRLLTLIQEKRTVQVSHAITQGLGSGNNLKPSGFPWLGDIPQHWDVQRSKRLLLERNERSETGEEEMLTVSHLTGVTPRSEKDVNMFEAESNEGCKLVSPNDLVINTLWAWMGAMGVSRYEGIVSPAYHVYSIGQGLEPAYVDHLVRIDAFKAEVIRFSKGVWSSRLRLYPEGLFEIWLPVPPREEQKAIVAFLATERERTAALEKSLRESLELLQERRRALITAAVTGQIREFA